MRRTIPVLGRTNVLNLSSARRQFLAAIVSCVLFAAAPAFAGPSYHVVDLNFPSGTTDKRETMANGISNGTIAGAYFDSRIHSADGHPLAWFGSNHDRVMLPQSPDEVQSVASSA